MLVKYYNNPELAYTTRKRYNSFNFEPFYEEEQKTILLGNGARTSIKTSSSNICNYVQIDDTRWFVISYTYLNGGQVRLSLQRDVIGEFGITNCYGKIERGYTDSILKNRKELSLNQVLKKRIPLINNNKIYGNYSVNTHDKELWGILYLAKPTGIDPNTGKEYEDKLNINIPAFNPKTINLEYKDFEKIPNGNSTNYFYEFTLGFYDNGIRKPFSYKIRINFHSLTNSGNQIWYEDNDYGIVIDRIDNDSELTFSQDDTSPFEETDEAYRKSARVKAKTIADFLSLTNNPYFSPPVLNDYPEDNIPPYEYDNAVIKYNDKFYKYSLSRISENKFGNFSSTLNYEIVKEVNDTWFSTGRNFKIRSGYSEISLVAEEYYYELKNIELSASEAGTFIFDLTTELVDEPYSVCVFPLFDVTISGEGKTYNINRESAFMIFNTVIQYLSGESPYLVDAQVYPYCPTLTNVFSEIKEYPFFGIQSNTFSTLCSIQLFPYKDIKKEYITRQYSVVSPEQSGKFSFEFYDYINKIESAQGISENLNSVFLNFEIKTSLKPFTIISSCVIIPENGSLMNMTYPSDLRGTQPSGGGFEASIATNRFEEYKRNNSNYQQIFNLQRGELEKQHEVERVNESVGAAVNTITATTMGAIAGAELAGAGGRIGRGIGAAAGGGIAGLTVGLAMEEQTRKNEELREYEEYLLKERFDLNIGTIKNLPNTISRISSFNEIILKDFYYVVEVYECTDYEKQVVDNFITNYGYGIGVYDFVTNYQKNGWFIRADLITSTFNVNLHEIAKTELAGGIYIYESI